MTDSERCAPDHHHWTYSGICAHCEVDAGEFADEQTSRLAELGWSVRRIAELEAEKESESRERRYWKGRAEAAERALSLKHNPILLGKLLERAEKAEAKLARAIGVIEHAENGCCADIQTYCRDFLASLSDTAKEGKP